MIRHLSHPKANGPAPAAAARPAARSPAGVPRLLQLQRSHGNQFVQRQLRRALQRMARRFH